MTGEAERAETGSANAGCIDTGRMSTGLAPPSTRRWRRSLTVVGLVVASVALIMLAWVRFDPFHVAQRDADRVYRQFTGHDPQGVRRDGTYIGDQLPTGLAYGPLAAPTTIREQMLKARAALTAAGYRPADLSSLPRLWCTVDSWAFWRPGEEPATVHVTCSVVGSTAGASSTAQISLKLELNPEYLHLSTTATGYRAVSADTAPDLHVYSGTVVVSVSQSL
jgi:hypothetical protein